jgi:PERQ amino acid-rich with GYF domain-containing protein
LSSIASPGVYVPPHANAGRSGSSDQRYGRSQLLDLFKNLQEAESLADGLASLYVDGWKPNITNGTNHGWGRKEESGKDAHPGADVCWDRDGAIFPLCLAAMTDEEKEVSRLLYHGFRKRLF